MDVKIDLAELSLTELKALAYDQLAARQQSEGNLIMINQEIDKRNRDAGANNLTGSDPNSTVS